MPDADFPSFPALKLFRRDETVESMKSHRSGGRSVSRGQRGAATLLADEGYDSDGGNDGLHSGFEAFASNTNRLFDTDGRIENLIKTSTSNAGGSASRK